MKLWIVLLSAAAASAQNPEVNLRLQTAGGRTSYHLGEAIGLELSFTSTVPAKYRVWGGGQDRTGVEALSESFEIAPREGSGDPLAAYFQGGIAVNGLGWEHELSAEPIAVRKDLNQWVRFDRPGRYRVIAVSHRVRAEHQSVEVRSNEIAIELTDDPQWRASQAAEAARVLREVPKSGASDVFETRMAAARQLWYLDTPESLRESVRLLDGPDVQVEQLLRLGLIASSHRQLAIESMRQLLADPKYPVAPIFRDILARLEEVKPASISRDLAAAIERKQGAAKAVSLFTLIQSAETADAVPDSQRTAMATAFLDLPPQEQSSSLSYQWSRISSPAMLPVLRKIYDTAPDPQAGPALERLFELDPKQGRPLLLAEIARPSPRFPLSTLTRLPDATLPELDAPLLANLDKGAPHAVEELIARYATGAILEGVTTFYAYRVCEPPLYAYFLRADPAYGEKVLRQVLANRDSIAQGCWATAIGRTAPYYVNAQWESVALDALSDGAVIVKIDAVKALGQYGSPAAKARLFDSFRYFHDWWKGKPAEINDENRQLEWTYVQAITQPADWMATADDLALAGAFCITDRCRGEMEQARLYWSKPLPVSAGRSSDGSYYVEVAQFHSQSLAEGRRRLLQLPAGAHVHWEVGGWPDRTLETWVEDRKRELQERGINAVN